MTSIHTQQEVTTMNELTDEKLAELRRAVEVVAKAPWDVQGGYPAGVIAPDGTLGSRSLSGAQLADAVSIVLAVLDEVERLRQRLELIRDGDPAALEAVGLGYLAHCGVDEGGKNYHGMRCDCWGPRDRP